MNALDSISSRLDENVLRDKWTKLEHFLQDCANANLPVRKVGQTIKSALSRDGDVLGLA